MALSWAELGEGYPEVKQRDFSDQKVVRDFFDLLAPFNPEEGLRKTSLELVPLLSPEEVWHFAQRLTDVAPGRACPCLFTEPCHERCTCVQPFSSTGCSRCCSYGSDEQRRAQAEFLQQKRAVEYQTTVKACGHVGVTEALKPTPPDGDEWVLVSATYAGNAFYYFWQRNAR